MNLGTAINLGTSGSGTVTQSFVTTPESAAMSHHMDAVEQRLEARIIVLEADIQKLTNCLVDHGVLPESDRQ